MIRIVAPSLTNTLHNGVKVLLLNVTLQNSTNYRLVEQKPASKRSMLIRFIKPSDVPKKGFCTHDYRLVGVSPWAGGELSAEETEVTGSGLRSRARGAKGLRSEITEKDWAEGRGAEGFGASRGAKGGGTKGLPLAVALKVNDLRGMAWEEGRIGRSIKGAERERMQPVRGGGEEGSMIVSEQGLVIGETAVRWSMII